MVICVMGEKQLEEINDKLDKIVRLLAQGLLKDMKFQKEKILMLYSIGYRPLEIAQLLGTSSNTVNVTLSEARKEGMV